MPDRAPLGVVGQHDETARRADQRAVGLGLQQVRCGEARRGCSCRARRGSSRSTLSERIAVTATGPTSASEGVRMPPVSTTVWSARLSRWNTSAIWIEFVTTVSSGTSARWWASVQVVVPAESAIAVPGRTSRAARRAMASFSALLARRLGGEARAPRWSRRRPSSHRRAPCRSGRGRREPPGRGGSSCPRRRTLAPGRRRVTPPCCWTRSRIACCRCWASIDPPLGDGHRVQRALRSDICQHGRTRYRIESCWFVLRMVGIAHIAW